MLFVGLAVLGGLGVGLALGGSLRRLEALSLRPLPVLAGAVVIQVVSSLALSGWLFVTGLVVSLLLAAAFVLANPHLAGRGLIVGGLALNALVIIANGAMPVQLTAAARAGVATGPIADDPRHEIADVGTRLAWLDDRIPLPLPLEPQVLSTGDVLVAAGVALLLAQGTRRRIQVPAPIEVSAPTRRSRRPPGGSADGQAPCPARPPEPDRCRSTGRPAP